MKQDETLIIYATKMLHNYQNLIVASVGNHGLVMTEKQFKLIKKQAYVGVEIGRDEVVKIRDFLNEVLDETR